MFDSVEELLRKIRLGEDSLLELKAVHFRGGRLAGPQRSDVADEIAAMANTAGGVLVLGIDDKTRDVEGIPIEKLDEVERLLHQALTDSIVPPLDALVIRMELPSATGEVRPVIKVDIPRSLFVHKSPGGYFYRLGSSKRELAPDRLARLFQQRSQARVIRFDEQAVPGTTLSDLDLDHARIFFPPGHDDEVALRKLLLVRNDDDATLRVTVGGLLLFGKEPQEFLPNAYVAAVHYRGLKRDSNYQIDAIDCRGALERQIDEAVAFMARSMKVSAIKTPQRQDLPQFSLRALFEAVVNAVVHRDYSVHGSKIRLFLFDDRVEIYSPGPLVNSVTVETMATRQATRNELVIRFLSKARVRGEIVPGRAHYVEARGEGVPLILEEGTEVSGRTPEYRLFDDELLLTIWGRPYSYGAPSE